MKTWIVFLLSALSVSAQTDFLGDTNIDQTVILVRQKGTDAEADEFHKLQGAHAKKFKHLKWSVVKLNGINKRAFKSYKSGPFDAVEFARIVHLVAIPNDPLYPQTWGMSKIEAPRAWDKVTGSADVIVAVIDTGITYSHEDLMRNLWTGPNGEHGYTASGGSVFIGGQDDHFHGTHVAGIIAGVGNNGVGVAGVLWQAKLLSLKFIGASGSGSTADAIACIDKMVDLKLAGHNIRVCNNSWGGGEESQALTDAFNLAEQAGIISICAAGNDGRNTDADPFFPASSAVDSMISVLASDVDDTKAPFSNYGQVSTDVLAPGVRILSCGITGNYIALSGTSMAAPHVAGVCAALFSLNPLLTPKRCKDVILNPDSLDHVAYVENSTFGGRLNFGKVANNPFLYDTNGNRSPTMFLSSGTNAVLIDPGQAKTVTAFATDPDGDALHYSATVSRSGQNDGWLIEACLGRFAQTPLVNTNSITITNHPLALDLGSTARFGVTDGKGGSDVEKAELFSWRANDLVRTLPEANVYVRTVTGLPNPVMGLSEIGVSSNHANWTVIISSPFQGYGQIGVNPVNMEVPLYRPIDPGPNIFRAQVMDTNGNFINSPRYLIDNGNTGQYAPEVKLTLNTQRGASPLNVVADMTATDPGNVHQLRYLARYWRGGAVNADPEAQVRTFTLTQPGLHPVEFVAYDANANLSDSYVVMFTVLPASQTNPPAPILTAPRDLAATAYGGLMVLVWTDTAILEDRWELEQRTKSRGKWSLWRSLATLAPKTEDFSFVPKAKTPYEFRIKACVASKCGEYSNVAKATSY